MGILSPVYAQAPSIIRYSVSHPCKYVTTFNSSHTVPILHTDRMSNYFGKLSASYKLASFEPHQLVQLAQSKAKRKFRLVDEEDATRWRADLPDKFSALKDEHFPLFITFDHVSPLCLNRQKDNADCISVVQTSRGRYHGKYCIIKRPWSSTGPTTNLALVLVIP